MRNTKHAFILIHIVLTITMTAFAQTNLKIVTPLFQATDVSEEDVSKYAFAMRGKAEIVDINTR